MQKSKLIQEYQALCPNIETVYVLPNMDKLTPINSYLYLFYKEIIEDENHRISISSFSFFDPRIVLRRIVGQKSILHHHWLEFHNLTSFLNVLWKIFWIPLYKIAGGKVVWTIHNKEPHHKKYRLLNRLLRKLWVQIPDRIHVHCLEAANIMGPYLNIAPKKFFILEHPAYPVSIMPQTKARTALKKHYPMLKIDDAATIFLMFGYIAEYKGIKEAAQIFTNLDNRKVLIVAGQVKPGSSDYWQKVLNAVGEASNIALIDKFIPKEHESYFFNAADYCLFNFSDILSSGGVELAKCYGKKLMLPNIGCLKNLKGEGVIKFGSPSELENILRDL